MFLKRFDIFLWNSAHLEHSLPVSGFILFISLRILKFMQVVKLSVLATNMNSQKRQQTILPLDSNR